MVLSDAGFTIRQLLLGLGADVEQNVAELEEMLALEIEGLGIHFN